MLLTRKDKREMKKGHLFTILVIITIFISLGTVKNSEAAVSSNYSPQSGKNQNGLAIQTQNKENSCEFLHSEIPERSEGDQFQEQYKPTENECGWVQIIVMIDQSSSMRVRNDPDGLRFYGPMNLVDILGKNYLLAKQSGSSSNIPLKIDFSVLHFGGDVPDEFMLDWVRIAPTNEAAWEEQKKEISEKISPDYLLKTNLPGGTNFIAAFEKAAEMAGEEPQVNGCPQRILLLLTDGNPDISGDMLVGSRLDSHMSAVRKIMENSFNGINDRLYVTAFQSDDHYWDNSGLYWQEISKDSKDAEPRHAKIVSSRPEIGLRLADIIQANLGELSVKIQPGPVVVPPYVQLLRLTFYPPDPTDFMELRDPGGKVVNSSRTDIAVEESGKGTAIQVIEVKNPTPGEYQIATSAKKDDVLITMQPIFIRTEVLSPTTNLLQFSSESLQLELIDSDGNNIPVYADERYQLKLNACIVDERGQEFPVSLISTGGSNLVGSYVPMTSGKVSLYIQGTALDEKGETWEVLNGSAGIFYVDPVSVTVGDAVGQGGCQPFQYQIFEMPLNFINKNNDEKVPISLPITWKVNAVSSSGETISDAIVKEDPNDPDGYILEAKSNQAGSVNIKLEASAPNPVNGELVNFFDRSMTIPVLDGQQAEVDLTYFTPLAKPITKILPALFNRELKSEEGTLVLTGRILYFIKNTIEASAKLTDTETGKPILDDRELPGFRLQSTKSGEIFEGGKWQMSGEGQFISTFKAPKAGCYRIMTTGNPQVCGTSIAVTAPVKLVCFVPSVFEQILSTILTILSLAGFFVLISFLLNKFINPLKGFMGILDANNRLKWYHDISGIKGKGLWGFKEFNPAEVGGTLRINNSSWARRKNELKVTIQTLDNFSNRKTIRKIYTRSIDRWQDIPLNGGCTLVWRQNPDDLSKFR